jgi:hypothetical protein
MSCGTCDGLILLFLGAFAPWRDPSSDEFHDQCGILGLTSGSAEIAARTRCPLRE